MGLKKYVSGQWVDDSGVDVPVQEVKIDNTSIVNASTDTASIATTGSYDGDSTSPSYNPLSTKGYVDGQISQLPEPMVYTGVISITADSTDTTKCSIAVSAPASVANIKKGFTYKVSFIAASPAYTGTIKIGDTLIASKDAPKVDATWVVDTDWNVIPTGDEIEIYNAGKTVPQGTSVSIHGITYTVGAGAEIFNKYDSNEAIGDYSHAEGRGSYAIGNWSHAEGTSTIAAGNNSHAEGAGAYASGDMSHAEGSGQASGFASHAEGFATRASSDYQHAEGKYNVEDSNDKFAHIIGNGTADNARSNAFAIDWYGKIYVNNALTGVDVSVLATYVILEQEKTVGMTAGGSNYITVGGIRVYVSSTVPTGTIPDGSLGIGF